AYFLVKALEQAGEMADATMVLRQARTMHTDSIWLNGRVLANDRRQPASRQHLPSTSRSAPNEDAVSMLFQARADMRSKEYEQSLERFRWIFRSGLPDASLPDRAIASSIVFWHELARVYAPAAAELNATCASMRSYTFDQSQSSVQRRRAFQAYVAATSASDQAATTLFMELVEASDPLSRDVVSLVQPQLTPEQFAQFEQRFPNGDRAFPRVTSVRTTEAMGDERQQFVTLLTLIAMQHRIGNSSEAHAIAADAKRIWSNANANAEIDAALRGEIPKSNQ
ncbi:MAG: hypothetical protein KDA87_22490, partial [Planctomycetales bacterium]|nr:hypothetical protein [Planctomycetales bacterium]